VKRLIDKLVKTLYGGDKENNKTGENSSNVRSKAGISLLQQINNGKKQPLNE
jgi:hypothetical protein